MGDFVFSYGTPVVDFIIKTPEFMSYINAMKAGRVIGSAFIEQLRSPVPEQYRAHLLE
jgi:hypothetical protein